MASKAERKRRKNRTRAKTTLPGGEVIVNAANDGRKPKENPMNVALEARLRVAGIPVTPEALKAAVEPSYGDEVGLCINALATGDMARAMWDTFCRLQAARRLYRMRHIGQTGDPQNSAIAMVPDAMQADPGLTIDIRTPEERDEAAKRAEAYWRGKLDKIPVPQLRMALRSAADGFNGPWWRDGKPTRAGRWAVDGLRWVVNGDTTT